MPASKSSNWTGRHSGKDQIRDEIWAALKREKVSLREPFGHIPGFVGEQKAAERLADLPIWKNAHVIKVNPDSPQIPVRLRALQEGRLLYMAVPRLTKEQCFVELSAEDLSSRGIPLQSASTANGGLKYGRLVFFEEMQVIDLVVTGCVAVTRQGGRTGKGAGFADLELGMLREFGLIRPDTPIVTTVHPLQIIDDDRLPMQAHDSALNWIITPEEIIDTHTPYPQPKGLDWDRIQPDQFESIPILKILRQTRKMEK